MLLALVFLVLMFLGYNYLVFELIDTLLENPKLKKIYRIPVGIVNTLVALVMTVINGSTAFGSYVLIAVMLLVEFILFYKDKFFRSLFCMLAPCNGHPGGLCGKLCACAKQNPV